MLGIHDLPLFVAAGLALNLTPGADVAVIVARSVQHGLRAGALVALGVGAGCGVHVAAAALGVAALLAAWPLALEGLRWLGAAYLVWLGVGFWRAAQRGAEVAPAEPGAAVDAPPAPVWMPVGVSPLSWQQAFLQGFLTNALNPKVALFFLAFVPQFVRADSPHPAAAFALLGLIFAFNGTVVNLGFAWCAVALGQRFGAGGRAGRWLSRAVAVLFVLMGLNLALGGAAQAAAIGLGMAQVTGQIDR